MDSGLNATPKLVVNPYVGPRPFTREDAPLFFGRDVEARDLLSLVISGQLVLFYSQSGAGKSSLINTRLIPGLEERNFEVLPIGRVSGDALKSEECDNIFVVNLLTHLDQSKAAPQRFAKMRLADFLANLAFDGTNFLYTDPSKTPPPDMSASTLEIDNAILPRVLIIDQFEEIATTHIEVWEKRADLLMQIAEAMQQDPYLWVVLVMREDYVATLDPFAHLLPNQLRSRFYMRRMEYASALDAVRKPVEDLRPFDPGIAEMLVDNLRLASDPQSQSGRPVYGEFIEPVQLQVVCYQLWASLMKDAADTLTPKKNITQRDIDKLAKGENLAQFINKALRDFYEQALASVLEKLPAVVSEANLRSWFSTQLITEAETRGFVYQGKTQTAGLANEAVNLLASYYIIRPESRPRGTWFELIHDRFVGPILQSNREWVAKNQSRLFMDAKTWEETGHPQEKLYEGKQLEAASAEVQQKGSAITEVEKRFVNMSVLAAKQQRDIRRRLIISGLIALFTVLSGLSWWALSSRSEAVDALTAAQTANQAAEQARDTAVNAQATVGSQNATAEFQTTALVQQAINQFDSISRLQTQIAPLLVTVLPTETLIPTQTQADQGDSPTPVETFGPAESPTETPTPSATAKPFEQKIVIGKSAKGQDIIAHQFGNGPRHVIFVGGLHAGYAPSTVEIARKLISYLRRNPDAVSAAVTVDVVLNANPDSLNNQDLSATIAGRYNAHGVDLNTNWDCNWKQDATWPSSNFRVNGGDSAFSEPETRVLKEYILSNLSIAVIVWEARGRDDIRGYYVNPGGCGEVSVFSQPLSDQYASAARYTSNQYVPYSETGSMVDWLDSQGIPSISVYFTDLNNVPQQVVDDQVKGLQAIIENYAQAAP